MDPVTPTEAYEELAAALGVAEVYFKREDLHPYGSHKGRSIPVMIDRYAREGDRHFVISSSGNAGLAAALYVKELNASRSDKLSLEIYIGNNAAPHKAEKLRSLADDHIRVIVKERPIQAVTMASNEGARSLRQSIDDTALVGYQPLIEELSDLKKAGAVFIGTSSGTTAQALSAKFQTHIVQTSSCHPFADAFETYDGPDERSIADAISDLAAHRKSVLIPLIQKSGGRGWIVTNDEIEAAQTITFDHTGLEISTNSALSVAGLMKAAAMGHEFTGPVICLICGE